MSCVIFGAGKIARGFIGHLLYLSDIPFVFVERSEALVNQINERGSYTVNILGAPDKNCVVKGVRALSYSRTDEIACEIARADAVFNAVGGKNLEELISSYVSGIEKRAVSSQFHYLRELEKPGRSSAERNPETDQQRNDGIF